MFVKLNSPQLFDKALRTQLTQCCSALKPKSAASADKSSNSNGSSSSSGGGDGTANGVTTTSASGLYRPTKSYNANSSRTGTSMYTTGSPDSTGNGNVSEYEDDGDGDDASMAKKSRPGSSSSNASAAEAQPAHSVYNSIAYQQRLVTPKQELFLFLRWLDEKFAAKEEKDEEADEAEVDVLEAAPADATLSSDVDATAMETTDLSAAPPRTTPAFEVTLEQRQQMMEAISQQLSTVLAQRTASEVVETVRLCEYELLMKADSMHDYTSATSLAKRIAREVALHEEWGIRAVVSTRKSRESKTVDLTAENSSVSGSSTSKSASGANHSNTLNTATSSSKHVTSTVTKSEWRAQITEEIRQEMIYRVEKMLRLVSVQLGIVGVDDLNHKIQQVTFVVFICVFVDLFAYVSNQ